MEQECWKHLDEKTEMNKEMQRVLKSTLEVLEDNNN